MLTKEKFVEQMAFIEKIRDTGDGLAKVLSTKYLGDDNIFNLMEDKLVDLLIDNVNDVYDYIPFWIYEMDFGGGKQGIKYGNNEYFPRKSSELYELIMLVNKNL